MGLPRNRTELMRAALLASAAGIGAAAAGAAAVWHRLLRRPLPRTSGTIEVGGIASAVRISRDRWGVPHIEASDRRDLWFAQGFVHAQDRLWQMDFYRRVACGRLAEIAGGEGLAVDRLMRTLGLRHHAEAEARAVEPELTGLLDAYCAGVNAGAAGLRSLPVEFRLLRVGFAGWGPADVLSLGKLLAFGLSGNWERELLRADMVRALGPELTVRLDPAYPVGNPIATHESFSGDGAALAGQIDAVRRALGMSVEPGGSNNWAVAGARSATGGPLVAGDPHLPPSMPGIWHQVSLSEGGRTAAGAAMAGLPGVYMGQNDDVVWTFTNTMADVQDLFVERVEGDRYLFEGEWRELDLREEWIEVKGRDEPVHMRVRSTHHGPIVNEALGADGGEPLSLRWIALDDATTHGGVFDVLDATSGPEMVRMLSTHTTPVSNLVWADRHGSIGFKVVGRLPIRSGGCPDVPKPGWTGEFEWEGAVPYEELPESVDPARGFLVTANNRVVGDAYPHHITSEWFDGFRARRIEEMLEARPEHDLDSFRAIQTDVLSIPGLEAARRLGRLRPTAQREVGAIERLRSWDGRMDPGSVAASIYQAFLLRLAREVTRSAIGDRDLGERWLDRADNGFSAHVTSPWRWHSHLMGLWEEGDPGLIGRPWDELALDSLRGALDDLTARFGPDPEGWQWGRVHEMEFPHPLGAANPLLRRLLNRRLRVGGAQETVSQIAYDPNDPYRAVWAPSWRMVADACDPARTLWQAFTGQSGHPASRHYDDLQRRWLAGEMQPMAGEGPWRVLNLVPVADRGRGAVEVSES
ncbi:MAG: penicillin acylase family protein [Solirubrobacterales bacterium]